MHTCMSWAVREEKETGWGVNMTQLLDIALHAHSGLERWREVQSLDVRVSLTGALYRLKGYPEGVPNLIMRINACWRAKKGKLML